MNVSKFRFAFWLVALTTSFTTASVHAGSCSGVSVGTSSTADVTFAGADADLCVISTVNPQQGAGGDSSGFDGAFGPGSWSLLGKITSAAGSAIDSGVRFSWTYSQLTTKTGFWSLKSDKDVTLDLVFAMHAANRSGAFLFDNQSLTANQVDPQTWTIKWLNNGGQVPNFSNLTLFDRNIAVSMVPEPDTSALLWAGLGAIGFVSRRRQTR